MPEFIVTQTKKEYYNEQYNKLRFFWWAFSSLLFTLLAFFFSKPWDYVFYIFFGFMALFIWQDLTKNRKTKSKINFFLGILYFIWGILFVYFSIVLTLEEGLSISLLGFIISIIFLRLGYKMVNKHSNLFRRFKKKKGKKSNWEKVNKPKSWIFRKAKKRKSNIVNGENYKYKIVKKGNRKQVYRKRK